MKITCSGCAKTFDNEICWITCPHERLRPLPPIKVDLINHPPHYGADIPNNPYEPIKVIEAWGLGFCLGNAVKYICRAGKKGSLVDDLKKAQWYLSREIQKQENSLNK